MAYSEQGRCSSQCVQRAVSLDIQNESVRRGVRHMGTTAFETLTPGPSPTGRQGLPLTTENRAPMTPPPTPPHHPPAYSAAYPSPSTAAPYS